jgi:hypothetical protein
MADDNKDDVTVVPMPGAESEAERKRVRKSNDRDQQKERRGEVSRHNEGYDEAADGVPTVEVDRVVDEE